MDPWPPRLPDHTSRTPRPGDRLGHRLTQRKQYKGRDRRATVRTSTPQHIRHCYPRIHNRRHHTRPTLHLPLHPNRQRHDQTDTRRSRNSLPPPTPKRGHLPGPLPRMDRSIPPRPLHRLHPAITRPPRSKRLALTNPRRSEERRVGKECRSRWAPEHYKEKRESEDKGGGGEIKRR